MRHDINFYLPQGEREMERVRAGERGQEGIERFKERRRDRERGQERVREIEVQQ